MEAVREITKDTTIEEELNFLLEITSKMEQELRLALIECEE